MKNGEIAKRLETLVSTMTEDELFELFTKAIKEDYDLNSCKKCSDCLAEQFILNYIGSKHIFALMVKDAVKASGIEAVINNSGISRKTWEKILPKR